MSDSDPASAKKIICSLFCFCVWADCRFNASTQIRRIDRAICDRQMAFRSTFTALCPSKLVEGKTVHRRPCLGERVSWVLLSAGSPVLLLGSSYTFTAGCFVFWILCHIFSAWFCHLSRPSFSGRVGRSTNISGMSLAPGGGRISPRFPWSLYSISAYNFNCSIFW